MRKLTLLTACLNAGNKILRACRSVDAQVLSNGVSVEHLILDGASQDGTAERMREYETLRKRNGLGKGIDRTVISEPDSGLYDALNRGLMRASGEAVGILNSDDFLAHPETLSHMARALRDSQVDGVYGDLLYVKRRQGAWIQHRYWRSGKSGRGSLGRGWMPPHPTLSLRKEIYDRTGGFRTDLGTAADYEFLVRLMHSGEIRLGYLPEVLVCMEVGGMSNRSLAARWKAHLMDRRAWSVNGAKPGWFTLALKPLHKLPQLWRRHKTFAFPEWAD